MKAKFQVVIPLTGEGSRFINAGYKTLKPLIEIHGRPMIEHMVKKMFNDNEDEIIFVCREDHLVRNPNMEPLLQSIAPNSKILAIKKWEKKGPVVDIMKISEHLDNERPIVVSYCDYFMSWDWKEFKEKVLARNCDGAIPVYTGFHPHLVAESNLYASCLIDHDDNLIEIKEKYSFEDNKFQSKHSPGLYFFKNAALLKIYYQKAIESNLTHSGEFFSSLPYNLLVKDSLKVWVPTVVDAFCQWGTPKDLADYLFWTKTVKGFIK